RVWRRKRGPHWCRRWSRKRCRHAWRQRRWPSRCGRYRRTNGGREAWRLRDARRRSGWRLNGGRGHDRRRRRSWRSCRNGRGRRCGCRNRAWRGGRHGRRREIRACIRAGRDRDYSSADRAPRAHAARRNSDGINAEDRVALRATDVHALSPARMAIIGPEMRDTPAGWLSVRRSTEYTEPSSVLA
ncbi:MAG: hypothetical protein JWM95_3383, partial [Gemmatimonadetes bacterium]|nr:hypothetical protein [Gemmatimonadota bacterium]